MTDTRKKARDLLRRLGRTYAQEAGINLTDKPGPLYQLLVLTTLLSTRIRAGVGVAAARELFAAGYTTAAAMAAASWQDRVDALGRGHYRRYDERTATMLGEAAQLCLDRWHGDLRGLDRRTDGDLSTLRRELTAFPGIGDTGADIFLREVQAVWPRVRPFVDRRAAAGARRVGLPTDGRHLADLVDPEGFPPLVSALVRVDLADGVPVS